jgi:DNA (cytosine-5)-methyltransferase 1
MRVLDLFSGIGGFRFGMEAAGHQTAGWVEIDKYARQAYKAIHQPEGEWTAHDITSVTDDDIRLLGRERGPINIICGGFPCQAFSVAGKRGGFNDVRGTLFFEIARFASILQPKYILLENVKGLLDHDEGSTFEVILRTLDELGYDAEWQVLDSSIHGGVPQRRKRVFIIGHSRRHCTRQVFPITGKGRTVALQQINGPAADAFRVYDSKGLARTLKAEAGGGGAKTGLYLVPTQLSTGEGLAYCLDANYSKGISSLKKAKRTHIAVLTPEREKKRQNGRRMKTDGEPMFTLTAQDTHGVYDGYRVRKLTPLECWRLQAFPDWAFYKAKETGLKDSQLYKQAGNSVTTTVIYEIAKRLI